MLDVVLGLECVHTGREGDVLMHDIAPKVAVPHALHGLGVGDGGGTHLILGEGVVQTEPLEPLTHTVCPEGGSRHKAEVLGAVGLVRVAGMPGNGPLGQGLDVLLEPPQHVLQFPVAILAHLNEQVVVVLLGQVVDWFVEGLGEEVVGVVQEQIADCGAQGEGNGLDGQLQVPEGAKVAHPKLVDGGDHASACLVHNVARVPVHVFDTTGEVVRVRKVHGLLQLLGDGEVLAGHPHGLCLLGHGVRVVD
mmetsp:Transcript_152502/g.266228  ORF Transcript_152502/g.266228 Transcript_152502/m.266228 type:complete len:249 (+) Transcript_152502:479-1225(+)